MTVVHALDPAGGESGVPGEGYGLDVDAWELRSRSAELDDLVHHFTVGFDD